MSGRKEGGREEGKEEILAQKEDKNLSTKHCSRLTDSGKEEEERAARRPVREREGRGERGDFDNVEGRRTADMDSA